MDYWDKLERAWHMYGVMNILSV